MNVKMLTRVRRHFVHDLAPRHIQRYNMRAWIKSVRYLGDKWLIAVPMGRKGTI